MQDFFNSAAGKVVVGLLIVLLLGGAVWMVIHSVGPDPTISSANTRTFIDAKTGKPFNVGLQQGLQIPIRAPSGANTGYPAELCYWTKDGKVRSDPYPVLLNSWIGKPEPTFCPDCGRLVVAHNPGPSGANAKAPPTKDEYKGSGADRDR